MLHAQEQAGSIRGVVHDDDFDAPLPGVVVTAVETGQKATTTDQGNYVLSELAPGSYTLVFAKDGYLRQVRPDVVVGAGRLTDLDVRMSGEFAEMEEFVVQDLQHGGSSEVGLLELRFESPSLLDSISADLLSRAGASDAAGALTLVSGASVQDGKFAVIRGLPDRYVSSQLNGVRLPSADEDTRAVELDQFPSAVIDSIQVSKTFTPDQQGDASGGAVDVRLKGIPEASIFELKSQFTYQTNVTGRSDFLSYRDGGVGFWGYDDGDRRLQSENIGTNWEGAVGVSEEDAPIDYKWSVAAGGKRELGGGVDPVVLGGFASFFYERDSSFSDDGVDDSWVVEDPGGPAVPLKNQETGSDEFNTALFDVTRSQRSVQWGGLGSIGIESEDHAVGLQFLHTRTTEDVVTLAEDTRGKQYFYPGYDPNDPGSPGYGDRDAAPYLRTETLEYTERSTTSLQLAGRHRLAKDAPDLLGLDFGGPELEWTLSGNRASQNQPDKRQFGSVWYPEQGSVGALFLPLRPSANVNLGNLQRIFKTIEEDGEQATVDLKLPFEQWSGDRGYVKLGLFHDKVEREFRQETFANPGDPGFFFADFSEFWSESFPGENHPIQESLYDVDYDGVAEIEAWYGMVDMPLGEKLNLIAGARFESTDLSIDNKPESQALWFPPGSNAPNQLTDDAADVDFQNDEVLPAISLVYRATDKLTLRAAYSQTLARQTFKELTPVIQQEFLGGPIFIGNPQLQTSSLENFDLRADYTPYEGGLLALSWFYKKIEDPIEYIQRLAPAGFTYTTPVNFPEGRLSGIEAEVRQGLGRFVDELDGFSVGANVTFIDSYVRLSADEEASFSLPAIDQPMTSRDATNAPEYLYNLYLTYDDEPTGVQSALFYTVRGDTLVAGAGATGEDLVPDVYETEVGTLNFTLSKRFGDHVKLEFKAKNLTDPSIEEVYRGDYLEDDVTKTSYTRGREFSIGLSITN